MIPKNKAKHIYNKFWDELFSETDIMNTKAIENTIQCALILVDEVIDQWDYIDTYIADMDGKLNQNLKYWHEVYKEILNINVHEIYNRKETN